MEQYTSTARSILYGMLQYETCPTYVLQGAMKIFERLAEADPVRRRGVVLRAIVAASFYYACRRFGYLSRTPAEIREIFRLEKRELTRGCRLLLRKQTQPLADYDPVHVVFIRFGNQLSIPYPYLCKTWKELEEADMIPKHGTPPTIAAGILYLIVKEQCLDRPDLATIANLTKVSHVIIETVCLNIQAGMLERDLYAVESTPESGTSDYV
jgi:transcription initiation factor TFIIIB Brf1 subunit/transcription initiation factor TFIIB